MADFSITLTVDDADVTKLVDALNWDWNHEAAPLTAGELRSELKTRVVKQLKSSVMRHKEYLRSQTPPADNDAVIT